MAYTKKYLPENSDIKQEWDNQETRIKAGFDNIADYIVEQGNNYEKWNSGKYVHRGTHTETVTANKNNSLTGPGLSRVINPNNSIVLATVKTASLDAGGLTLRRAFMNTSKEVTFLVHSTYDQSVSVDYEVTGWWK